MSTRYNEDFAKVHPEEEVALFYSDYSRGVCAIEEDWQHPRHEARLAYQAEQFNKFYSHRYYYVIKRSGKASQ